MRMFGVYPERTWMDVLFELELQLHSPADGEAVGIVSSPVGAAVVLQHRPLRTGPLSCSIWLSKSPLCAFLLGP